MDTTRERRKIAHFHFSFTSKLGRLRYSFAVRHLLYVYIFFRYNRISSHNLQDLSIKRKIIEDISKELRLIRSNGFLSALLPPNCFRNKLDVFLPFQTNIRSSFTLSRPRETMTTHGLDTYYSSPKEGIPSYLNRRKFWTSYQGLKKGQNSTIWKNISEETDSKCCLRWYSLCKFAKNCTESPLHSIRSCWGRRL